MKYIIEIIKQFFCQHRLLRPGGIKEIELAGTKYLSEEYCCIRCDKRTNILRAVYTDANNDTL